MSFNTLSIHYTTRVTCIDNLLRSRVGQQGMRVGGCQLCRPLILRRGPGGGGGQLYGAPGEDRQAVKDKAGCRWGIPLARSLSSLRARRIVTPSYV